MTLQQFCETAEDDLVSVLGHEAVSARLREASTGGMARFMALGCLALDVSMGRVGASRHASHRISVLPTPTPLAIAAALPTITAPTSPVISDQNLLALGKKVFGPGFVREGASRGDIENKFRMEQIRLPGVSGPTRELFGLEKMTQVSRQEIVDAFLKTGKL